MPVRIVIVFVVLAVVVVAADRVTAVVVARSVAAGLQQSQGLPGRPAVTFRRAPFLTQAVGGRYRRVDVTMSAVPTAGPLVVDELQASLVGVRAELWPALRGDLTELTVDHGTADAQVSFASLQAAAVRTLAGQTLGGRSVDVTLGYAAADRIAFTARLDSVLGPVRVSGQIQVGIQRGAVTVRLLPQTLAGVPSLLRSQVAAQVRLDGLVPPLPFGFRATRVAIEPTGLKLRAEGSRMRIPV